MREMSHQPRAVVRMPAAATRSLNGSSATRKVPNILVQEAGCGLQAGPAPRSSAMLYPLRGFEVATRPAWGPRCRGFIGPYRRSAIRERTPAAERAGNVDVTLKPRVPSPFPAHPAARLGMRVGTGLPSVGQAEVAAANVSPELGVVRRVESPEVECHRVLHVVRVE